MRSCIITVGIALLVAASAAGEATAQVISQGPYVRPQQFNPYRRPTLTPYLNLARGGNPAINYYGLVRPQFETQAQLSQLQQQSLDQQGQLSAQQGQMNQIPITGRAAGFQTHSGYFQNWNGRAGGTAGSGVGAGFGSTNRGGQGVSMPGTVGALSGGVSRPGRMTAPRPQGSRSAPTATTGPSLQTTPEE